MIVKLFNDGFKYIAYTNVFTGLCAGGLVAFNMQVLHQTLNLAAIVQIFTVGLFVTIGYQCSYSFNGHIQYKSYLPTNASEKYRHYIRWQLAVELLLFLFCFLYSFHFYQALLFMVTVIIGSNYYQFPKIFYPHQKYSIRYYGAYKTLGISVVWVILTLGVPLLNDMEFYFSSRVFYLFLSEIVFVGSLCLLFDLRDIKIDVLAGVNSIPVTIGRTATQLSIIGLTLLWLAITVYIRIYSLQQPFIYITAGWIAFMVSLQSKQPGKLFYLILVDGTMLLPFLSINF